MFRSGSGRTGRHYHNPPRRRIKTKNGLLFRIFVVHFISLDIAADPSWVDEEVLVGFVVCAAAKFSFFGHLVVVVHGKSAFRFTATDRVAAADDMRRVDASNSEVTGHGPTPERCDVPLQGAMNMQADEL